jgi:hypothetical protein
MLYLQINCTYNVTNACWVEPAIFCRQVSQLLTVTLHCATKCASYENNGAVAFNSRDSALNESRSL